MFRRALLNRVRDFTLNIVDLKLLSLFEYLIQSPQISASNFEQDFCAVSYKVQYGLKCFKLLVKLSWFAKFHWLRRITSSNWAQTYRPYMANVVAQKYLRKFAYILLTEVENDFMACSHRTFNRKIVVTVVCDTIRRIWSTKYVLIFEFRKKNWILFLSQETFE